jgi:nucleotide-binding universal stress UspA family protein
MEIRFLSRTVARSKQQSRPDGQVRPRRRPRRRLARGRDPAQSSDSKAEPGMHAYLVVMDETEEARAALRFAARRAARTGGGVEILALIPPQEFVQWSAVQEAMEEEARLRAEAMLVQATGAIMEEAGIKPAITIREGDAVKAAAELLGERDFAALVLGAAAEGGPGPLVGHFAGAAAGTLPCPLIVVPGGLGDEALARLA